ncbi:MAG: hypothetical protein JNL79_27430, partial [Myxococcales bacterium]|nr:hypothetical protein [Myxococcales bacterium]
MSTEKTPAAIALDDLRDNMVDLFSGPDTWEGIARKPRTIAEDISALQSALARAALAVDELLDAGRAPACDVDKRTSKALLHFSARLGDNMHAILGLLEEETSDE